MHIVSTTVATVSVRCFCTGMPAGATTWAMSSALQHSPSCNLEANILVQDVVAHQYEQEFEAFQSGKYKESAQNWLHSSWQGDALQAGPYITLPALTSLSPPLPVPLLLFAWP